MDGILEKSDGQRMGDIKGLTAEPAWYWPRKKPCVCILCTPLHMLENIDRVWFF